MKKWFILPMLSSAIFANAIEVQSLQTQEKLVAEKPKKTKELYTQTPTSSYKSAFSQSAFMPDISLIVDISYASRNIKDSAIAHLEVPGLAHGIYATHSHNGQTHLPMNANNGFNLNYAELGFASSVDNLFDLNAILHFSNSGVDIEEAYFTSTGLSYGLTLKGGKFLSDFGRLNSQHQHIWEFSDAPLIYKSFFGNHNINEIGASMQTTLPTPFYSLLGFELLQGDNQSSFGTSAITPANENEDIVSQKPQQPNLLIAYAKASTDIGDTTLLTGISYASGESRLDHQGDENPHAFSGKTAVTNIELTTKTMFDSYSYLQFQGEWMQRDMKGQLYIPNDAKDAFAKNISMDKLQEGYYAQLIYAFNKEYKVGLRYDNFYKNDVITNGINQNKEKNLDAYSVKLDYKASEFSLFRLQYNKNNALFDEDGEKQNLDEIIFEMNFAIGSHPAHTF